MDQKDKLLFTKQTRMIIVGISETSNYSELSISYIYRVAPGDDLHSNGDTWMMMQSLILETTDSSRLDNLFDVCLTHLNLLKCH